MGTHTGNAGAGTKQKQSVTAGSILKAAARGLLPAGREDMIGDSLESSRLDRLSEFAASVFAAWKTKALRRFHIALAVRVDNPPPEEVRRRTERAYWSLHRCLVMFVFALCIFCAVNAHMLPDVYRLHFFFSLAPGVVLVSIIKKHRKGLEGGAPRFGMTAISDAAYIGNLKRMIAVLIGGDFSPSKFAVRSGLDVFIAVMLFFSPAYVMLRWFAGDRLPDDTGIYGLLWRFAVAILLTFVFASIRKSNKYAAEVMEDQIDALQAAMDSPVSA
jgi:hypothetical protein